MATHPYNRQLPQTPRRAVLKACASGVLLCAAGFSGAAWAQQPLALSTAINRAGRLRALSQRIAKAYTQLTLGVLPERSNDVLATAQRIAKANLTELGRAGFSGETAELLAVCIADAERLFALVGGAPAAGRLAEVNKAADQMLAGADRLTGGLEGRGKSGAKIINIAGRQRMLSQRLAKSFMLLEAGQDSAGLRKQLDAARSEFVLALDALESAPVSTPAIKQDLMLARTQWMFYQSALDGKDKPVARRDVATTSERILEVMDSLTGLYDSALKELLGSSVAYTDTRYAGLLHPAG
ncbi:MAG: type IV pili methyl-accepting chemotaxis transducer N-terminal domain-containing protein [Pseudomonadota bacterium]|nr:type IV pili methyl-accepting chemotaxis transducer N-terminal domain-containing protein [Pseudomonadota bacterium]